MAKDRKEKVVDQEVKEQEVSFDEDGPFPERLTGEGVEHGTLRSNASPSDALLRNTLRAWHWAGYKRAFDLLQTVAPTDRSFEQAHKLLMDIASEQLRSLEVILHRLVPRKQPVAEEQKALADIKVIMDDLQRPKAKDEDDKKERTK